MKTLSKEDLLYAIMLTMLDDLSLPTNASVYCLAPPQLLPSASERIETPTFRDRDPGVRVKLGQDASWVLNMLAPLADTNELKAAIHSIKKLASFPEEGNEIDPYDDDPFADT